MKNSSNKGLMKRNGEEMHREWCVPVFRCSVARLLAAGFLVNGMQSCAYGAFIMLLFFSLLFLRDDRSAAPSSETAPDIAINRCEKENT